MPCTSGSTIMRSCCFPAASTGCLMRSTSCTRKCARSRTTGCRKSCGASMRHWCGRKITKRTCLRVIASGGTTTRPARWTKAIRLPWTGGLAYRIILMPPRPSLVVSLALRKKNHTTHREWRNCALRKDEAGRACARRTSSKGTTTGCTIMSVSARNVATPGGRAIYGSVADKMRCVKRICCWAALWFGISSKLTTARKEKWNAEIAIRSTDFEVHRNWLAITHSLPLSRWYYEKTSEWTLDYPPFFAYFEWLLSHVAKSFDPRMLDVKNLNYASEQTIVFQRFSVIVTDVIYALGVRRCLRALSVGNANPARSVLIGGALLLGNAGLLMVDHIHFQYNGFLFGVLLLSIGALLENRPLQSALLFAVLLNLKHIFMYVAPVYVVYLLRFYCLRDFTVGRAFVKLIKLATIVLGVCLLSFGPLYQHIPQVLSRLFPFKRGLTHAYWAPNFWALYNTADKVLAVATGKTTKASSTGGLVQTFDHTVLPSITPTVTFALTGLAMIPVLLKLWSLKATTSNVSLSRSFVRAIVLCGCTSFLFGWHVHEKAILMVLIPLTLLAIANPNDARWTVFLGVVAHYSLFPLLFKPELTLVKICLHVLYTAVSVLLLKLVHRAAFFRTVEFLYLAGFPVLCVYETVVHEAIGLGDRLPFLPLLLTSVYCALGVLYFWVAYQASFLSSGGEMVADKKKAK
uniref:Alpha-1,3-glucosyltransferase n=1 Tax=Anopheles epiroticus TaxID=199890 RepID=A0A182PK42_9DIPT